MNKNEPYKEVNKREVYTGQLSPSPEELSPTTQNLRTKTSSHT